MDIEITLKNYRCFSDTSPARFMVRQGFIAFVGVNNAGKSSLLKFFVEFRELLKTLGKSPSEFIQSLVSEQQLSIQYVKDQTEVFCNQNSRDLRIEIEFRDVEPRRETSEPLTIEKLLIIVKRSTGKYQSRLFADGKEVNFQGQSLNTDGWSLIRNNYPKIDLSSVTKLGLLANTFYIGPFRNTINLGAKEDYYDIRVGQAFIRSWRANKTGNSKSANEAVINLSQDIKRIFGFNSLEINATDDESDLKVFLDGKSYNLSELGGGLAQFIIVLGNAAIQRKSFILIDEPELNLHPSLQRDFLTTLGFYANEGVLFATHNIGLARASAEQIYSVRLREDGAREVAPLEALPTLSEFLGEMSFSGYRELGYRRLLLVEGASDVLALQQLLRVYSKDHEIVIMPLGGAEMIKEGTESQLHEIKRITDNIVALIDSERDTPNTPLNKNTQGFVDACGRAGIICKVLDRRAIENYFSERAIQLVYGPKYTALKPYERLKDAQNGWAKAENWKIAREMSKSDLGNTDLGEFLDRL